MSWQDSDATQIIGPKADHFYSELHKYNIGMKISNNPSRSAVRWRWHAMRIVAISLMLSSIWFPKHMGALIGAGTIVFLGACLNRASDEDRLVEVFDDGDSLRLELGDVRVSAGLTDIEKVEFQDGEEGVDYVEITLLRATPFGRLVELVPLPLRQFQWDVKFWVADLQRRVDEAKNNVAANTFDDSGEPSFDYIPPDGPA